MKKVGSLLLAVCLILSLASCGAKTEKAAAIELTDQAGRTVKLEKTAEKVVSCYYITSYAMLALNAKDLLVGIEKKAETRPIYAMTDEALLELPQVGSMKELNVEAIASLEPDLVLMPKKLSDYIPAVEAAGAQVLVVDPENDEKLCDMLTLVAEACGKQDECKALLEYRESKLEEVEKLCASAEKPTVYMGGNSSYMTAAPLDMYQSTLIEQAGGVNAAQLEDDYWTEVSYESILSMDPEIVVLPSDAEYTVEDFCGDKELSTLNAVQNGRVYKMPDVFESWDSPVPAGVLGTLWMLSTIHSDLYTADEFKNDVKEFYDTFYGFTPDDELLAKLG